MSLRRRESKFDYITRESVIDAIQEFDLVGPAAMIDCYGGGLSKIWWIDFEGEDYDQKLIFRAAHYRHKPDIKLKFKFGSNQSKKRLEHLGFEVKNMYDRNQRH